MRYLKAEDALQGQEYTGAIQKEHAHKEEGALQKEHTQKKEGALEKEHAHKEEGALREEHGHKGQGAPQKGHTKREKAALSLLVNYITMGLTEKQKRCPQDPQTNF